MTLLDGINQVINDITMLASDTDTPLTLRNKVLTLIDDRNKEISAIKKVASDANTALEIRNLVSVERYILDGFASFYWRLFEQLNLVDDVSTRREEMLTRLKEAKDFVGKNADCCDQGLSVETVDFKRLSCKCGQGGIVIVYYRSYQSNYFWYEGRIECKECDKKYKISHRDKIVTLVNPLTSKSETLFDGKIKHRALTRKAIDNMPLQPTVLKIEFGGALGTIHEIVKEDSTIRHKVIHGPTIEKEELITPSNDDWKRFLIAINKTQIRNWRRTYWMGITDGYAWEVHIEWGNQAYISEGYNDCYNERDYDKFCKAALELVGDDSEEREEEDRRTQRLELVLRELRKENPNRAE